MKSAFPTPLITECVDDLAAGGRGTWRVMSPFRYSSAILDRVILAPPGDLPGRQNWRRSIMAGGRSRLNHAYYWYTAASENFERRK